jgi:tetratricopeptide (TPR) repeat protein
MEKINVISNIKTNILFSNSLSRTIKQVSDFILIYDKQRQYLYRTHLETEHGDYKEALRFLKMSAALSSDSELRDLLNEVIQSSVFGVSAYVKLMAEAEDWETSKEMFKVLSNSSYIQGIEKKQKHYHPEQIILWKYAYYCVNNDMMNAAIKYYEKAFDSCFLDDDITLKAIGIGIGFEFLAMAIRENRKEVSSLKRQIRKRWEKIKEEDNLGILDNLFGCVDFDQNKYDYYLLLSKNVTY